MFLVLNGDVFVGLKAYGPFTTAGKACEWAADNLHSNLWTVSTLNSPGDYLDLTEEYEIYAQKDEV